MTTLRGCTALLMLLLAASGCRTYQSADPLGLENRSMLSSLAPQRSGPNRALGARRGATAGGDPFMQSTASAQASGPTGRATLSDAFGSDHDDSTSRGAAYLAAQSAGDRASQVVPVDNRAAGEGAVVQAAVFDLQTAGTPTDEAAARQRLQTLEWELQFTDDHDAQEQLALEIARLRKQLSRSRQ